MHCLQVVKAQAQSYGCKGEVDWLAKEPYYPPTVNDPRTFDFMMDVGARCTFPIPSNTFASSAAGRDQQPPGCHISVDANTNGGTRRVLKDSSKVVRDAEATLAGEDFSFYSLGGVPAAYAFLGIRNESAGSVHGLHTPQFTLDEGVLQTGAAFLASLAADFLESQQFARSREEL